MASVTDVARQFDRVGVDDTSGGVNTGTADKIDFSAGGTVKGCAKSSESGDDGAIRVAFDRVERLDAGKERVPRTPLLDDLAKVDHIEALLELTSGDHALKTGVRHGGRQKLNVVFRKHRVQSKDGGGGARDMAARG